MPDHVTRLKGVADWQLLQSPCPVFGQASYVARTWSGFMPAAAGQPQRTSVPFFAIYLALQPGATSSERALCFNARCPAVTATSAARAR